MIVTPVAHTIVTEIPTSLRDTEFMNREDWGSLDTTDLDILAETAGRGCYKSWSMPNPKTATNEGYLGNILEHQHYSVFEHGSVTFYIEDVSRALLLELERHRFTCYSAESQRYVDTGKHHPEAIIPPAIRESASAELLTQLVQDHYQLSLDKYALAYNTLRDEGLPVKRAREAARALLLESTPVDFFVTANVRAWRDVLGKRWSEGADAEIREFAGLVLGSLRELAPNSFRDVSETPSEY